MTPPDSDSSKAPDESASDATATAEAPATDAGDGEAKEKPKLSLEIAVDEPSACERHVTVTISREDVDRYIGEAYDELMPKAEVPGFRPGRAPRKLVESRFRKQIGEQVKGSLLMDSMTQVSEDKDFSAISEPDFDFDAIEVPVDGPMTFEFDIEVRPEFEVPKWKGLKIERPVREFTDAEVDEHLQKLLARYSELVPTDKPAEADGYVTIDISFRHNGREVSQLRGKTVQLKPNLSFHDGTLAKFDELLAGARRGDRKEAKFEVSHECQAAELRGQEVEAHITVEEIKQRKLPELNDEFLQKIGGFDDEGDLRDAVLHEMERQLIYHQQKRVRDQITAILTKSADWELPPDMLRRQAHRELERAVMELQRSGFSDSEIRAYENELRRNSRTSTERALKEHFILERIAEIEELDADPDDYDQEIALIASQQNESPRRIRARLEKRGQMDALRNQIIERKVIEMITEQADFKEVPFKPEKQTTEAIDFAVGGPSDSSIPEAKHGGQTEELKQPADRT